MSKALALKLLDGTANAAARIGVSYQAVDRWPPVLPKRIADRVIAAIAIQHPSRPVAQALKAMRDEAASRPALEA